MSVNDQAAWDQAVNAANMWYTGLSPADMTKLDDMINDVVRLKEKLVKLVIAAGSADICRNCGGECCRYGKYHVSVLDILTHLKSGTQLPIPDFDSSPDCPYSDASGCIMAPGFRPLTCVVFNCQQLEDRLSSVQLDSLHACEKELRNAITGACKTSGKRLERSLLLSCS